MTVVATADFDLYHEAMSELRSRGVTFTIVEPGGSFPERVYVLLTGPGDGLDGTGSDGNVTRVAAMGDDMRRAVDEAFVSLHGDGRQTVVGVDPGMRPGIAVLSGETVVAAFHVPLADVIEVIQEETDDAVDPVVRIDDGARLRGAKLINEFDGVAVEPVDETGMAPCPGSGTHGMGDVLTTVGTAHRDGECIESRKIKPTEGKLTCIKARSREVSEDGHIIDEDLARHAASGELSVDEVLDEHRSREE